MRHFMKCRKSDPLLNPMFWGGDAGRIKKPIGLSDLYEERYSPVTFSPHNEYDPRLAYYSEIEKTHTRMKKFIIKCLAAFALLSIQRWLFELCPEVYYYAASFSLTVIFLITRNEYD